jgi:hypothetical protein
MPSTHMDAALGCPLELFGHTVRDVMTDPSLSDLQRDVDVVELWSGVGSIVAAAQEYKALPFDIARCPGVTDVAGPETEDITCQLGFEKAMKYVFRLRPSGLLFMAPVCSSFGFCNMRNTKRNRNNVCGDESNQSVRTGNLMAHIAAFFLCIALARDVHVVIENPASSLIFSFIMPITDAFAGLKFAYADRCAYDLRRPGQLSFKKPYKFLVSGTWLESNLRRCSCKDGKHDALMLKNEKGQVTGRQELLKASAAYPPALGKAIVTSWLASPPVSHITGSGSPRWQRKSKKARLAASRSRTNHGVQESRCHTDDDPESIEPENAGEDQNPWGAGPWSSDAEGGPW